MRGESPATWRPWLHIEHAPNHQCLTDGREKYIWWPGEGREQLFDLTRDPCELHDLAVDAEAGDRLACWRNRLIERLSKRPEGFVRNGALVPGRPYRDVIPAQPSPV
jgi:hypothetical protein